MNETSTGRGVGRVMGRAALIDAAKRAAYDAWRADNDMAAVSDAEWSAARSIGGQTDIYADAVLDAVLPLIAADIEAEAEALRERVRMAGADLGPLYRIKHAEVDGRILAARRVRSYLDGDQ